MCKIKLNFSFVIISIFCLLKIKQNASNNLNESLNITYLLNYLFLSDVMDHSSEANYQWGKRDINWMCNHGKTKSPWITAINVVSSKGLQRILVQPKEDGEEDDSPRCSAKLARGSPPLPLQKQIHISRRYPLRCIRLRKETRARR